MFFSQRNGFKQVPEIQFGDINDDLRVGLWNAFYKHYLSAFATPKENFEAYHSQIKLLYNTWIYALKKPGDEFHRDPDKLTAVFKEYFLTAKWHEVFDIMEYAAGQYSLGDVSTGFILECNFVFEKEASAYRFVDSVIMPLGEYEITMRKPAATNTPLNANQSHLNAVLSLYSAQTKVCKMQPQPALSKAAK